MPKSYVSPAPAGKPLNLMQQRFVHEYLADGVATAAARRAGYSGKRARWQAVDLMKNPRVKAAIAAERARRAGPMTRQEAIEGLRRIAQANVLDYARPGADGALELDLWRLERDRAGAVKGLTVTERTDPKTGETTRTVGFALADRSAALIRLLPMLEADAAGAALERGRGLGVAAVAALSVEAFGRFKAALAQAGRGRGAEVVLEEWLAAEAARTVVAPGTAEALAALAAREADLEAREERLEREDERIWNERQAMVAQAQRLTRLKEEVEAGQPR
ncbi:MAG: hypothetical protein K0R83_2120 [Caulobacter sp.]|jgi:hypothetical protein|nr:hypothetical protein [Caulobacter sp.]